MLERVVELVQYIIEFLSKAKQINKKILTENCLTNLCGSNSLMKHLNDSKMPEPEIRNENKNIM